MTGHHKYCDFCGSKAEDVKRLVLGPTVAICDECVELAVGILEGPAPVSNTRPFSEFLRELKDKEK
jgi:ATP-dependent protease Clp ATPase subunit